MPTESVNVLVNQDTYAVGLALAKFAADVKAAFKAGGSVAEVTAIATAAVTDLLPQVQNLSQLVPEAQANLSAEVNTAALVGQAIYMALAS